MTEEQEPGVKIPENDWKSLNNRLDDLDKINKKLKEDLTDQAKKIEKQSKPVQNIVQIRMNQYKDVDTTTDAIPEDDTIPQSTEGKKFMDIMIKPTDENNILIIEAVAVVGNSSSGGNTVTMALFKPPDTNALAAVNSGGYPVTNNMSTLCLKHKMIAGTTEEILFNINIGSVSAVWAITFNGSSGARKFGAIPKSYIQVTEVMAGATE